MSPMKSTGTTDMASMPQMPHDAPLSKNRSLGASSQTPAAQSVMQEDQLLTDQQRVAVELMLNGVTQTAVAKAVGIDRKTLYRWRTEDTAFRDELHRRRSE